MSEPTHSESGAASTSQPFDSEKATPPPDDVDASPSAHGSQRTVTGFRWFLVCLGIFSANFLNGLDSTIAADLQASVAETYDNVQQLGWLGFGYGLGATASILPLGKACAVVDTKWVFVASLVTFGAGSALCGAAPTMDALIVGRIIAGGGGAGMYLGTLNLMTLLTSPKEQSFWMAFQGLIYGGGCILGPIIGGLFSDSSATWRWAFYVNLVIFGVMSPIYVFVLPSVPRQNATALEKLKSFDWLGIVLSAAMYVSLVLAFSFGGAIWDWDDGRFIALVVVWVVLLAAFALTQYFCVFSNEKDRIFPCDFLRDPQMILFYVAMSAAGTALFVSTYYIPLYYLFVKGETGTQAAVRLLPFIFFYITTIMVCGSFLPRTGYHWVWYLVSGLFLTAGGVAMYTIQSDTPPSHTYGFSVLLGLGLTIAQAPYSLAPQMVRPERISEVIQFLNNAQVQSQMLGLLIASAIFQSEAFKGMKNVLAQENISDTEIRSTITGSNSEVLGGLSPELARRALDVLVDTIRLEWIMVITAGAMLTVCSFFMTKQRFPRVPVQAKS